MFHGGFLFASSEFLIDDHLILNSSLLLWRHDYDFGASTTTRAMLAGSDKQGPTGSFFSFSILGRYGSGFEKKVG